MTTPPRITVAPNGARLQKTDHPALPVTADELARTARDCHAAGADAIHLHVRDVHGGHSLDPDLYRTAIAAVSEAAPGMHIQITTEAAGRYDVAAQLQLLQDLRPAAASIAVREIARAPELAARVYEIAATHNTQVQHILYSEACLTQLLEWQDRAIVPAGMTDAILVLGKYAPPRAGRPEDMDGILEQAQEAGLNMTVCAFGPDEQTCLLVAARRGCDLRVGFENNTIAPDGTPWASNAQAVASLRSACQALPCPSFNTLTGATDTPSSGET